MLPINRKLTTAAVLSTTVALSTMHALPTSALEYDYEAIVVPSPTSTTGRATIVGITNDLTIAADDTRLGGISARVKLSPLAIEHILCPLFSRYSTPSRGGPQVYAINNNNTVVGTDESATSGLWGIAQSASGECAFFQVPGSVGTILTGVNDSNEKAGFYWNTAPSGLLRFHGFFLDENGVITTLSTGSANDVLLPESISNDRVISGHAFRNITPTNDYTYQAFLMLPDGSIRWMDSPSGQDLWCPVVNSNRKVVCIVGTNNTLGGEALLYNIQEDTFEVIPKPTPTTVWIAPRALNNNDVLSGIYADDMDGNINTPPNVIQFLGTPVVDTPPTTPPSTTPPPVVQNPRKRLWWAFLYKRRERIVSFLEHWKQKRTQQHPALGELDRRWRPVWDNEKKRVVLVSGERVAGEVVQK